MLADVFVGVMGLMACFLFVYLFSPSVHRCRNIKTDALATGCALGFSTGAAWSLVPIVGVATICFVGVWGAVWVLAYLWSRRLFILRDVPKEVQEAINSMKEAL